MPDEIPVIDLTGLEDGSADPLRTAAELDRALHEVGFVLLAGHGIPSGLLDDARAAALAFFALPDEVKRSVAVDDAGYRGWAAVGSENNSAYQGIDTPPELREAFTIGPFDRPDDEHHRRFTATFAPNRYPDRGADDLRRTWEALYRAEEALCGTLLRLAEVALGTEPGHLSSLCTRHTSTLMANRYPPRNEVQPVPGQYRIGPHTDFGVLTLLDRQPGLGGLQVQLLDDRWVDAPHVPGTLVVNTGDLMELWTGGRWRSTRHRVLPPPVGDPTEELLSLVFFLEPDADAVVEPLTGGGEAVVAGEYIESRYQAMTGT